MFFAPWIKKKNLSSQNGIKTQVFIFYICLNLTSSFFFLSDRNLFIFSGGGTKEREVEKEGGRNKMIADSFFCCLFFKIHYVHRAEMGEGKDAVV